jgi:hypothetical protein
MTYHAPCPACGLAFPLSPDEVARGTARCPACGQLMAFDAPSTAIATEPLRTSADHDANEPDAGRISSVDLGALGAFRPGASLAWSVRIFAGIGMLLSVATIALLMQAFTMGRNEHRVPLEFDLLLTSVRAIPVAQTLCWAVTAGFFLAWFFRVYANLPELGARHLEQSPGWAVAYWFIPFANFVMPYRAAQEIWQHSDPDPRRPAATVPASLIVLVWWTVWLVPLAFWLVRHAIRLGAELLELPGSYDLVEMFARILPPPTTAEGVVLAALLGQSLPLLRGGLLIAVVSAIEGRQSARAAALGLSIPEREPEIAQPSGERP